jgi:hypothetical protein
MITPLLPTIAFAEVEAKTKRSQVFGGVLEQVQLVARSLAHAHAAMTTVSNDNSRSEIKQILQNINNNKIYLLDPDGIHT